jgi:sigma-B regulation protein RsbU (phosphoserine phosphatase)
MGIRNKLLALLLFISLAPLLVVGIQFRENLATLGGGLVERSFNTLMSTAGTALKRIVEDHARILRRENQLLESNAQFLASRIEGIIYGHEHAATDSRILPSAAQVMAAREDYYFLYKGGRQSLEVDFDAIEIRTTSQDFSGSAASPLNELLLPVLKNLKFRYSDLVLWIDIELSDGTTITYPKSASDMFLREPFYRDVDTDHYRELAWSDPQLDPRTRLLVFNINAPVKDETGTVRGHVTLVVPVSALLHKSPHLAIFSDNADTLLVNPETVPGTAERRLRVVAREQSLEDQRGHWGLPGRDAWLVSDDGQPYAAMLEALRSPSSGIADMRREGRDTLWAYAPIEPGGAALMILVPKADVVRETLTVREFILAQIGSHTRSMGIIILIVGGVVCAVAFFLSKLFTRTISRLASAVARVARGDFAARAGVRGNDEIARLGEAFDRMVPELEDRIHIKNALEVAQQIQQNLLPTASPRFGGHDIAAASEYCFETGGDYYGFIHRRNGDGESLVIAVGDVSGHGIPAALLMASARAYIRSQAACGGRLDHVAGRVNELVAEDTDRTGRFMTLFLLELTEGGAVRWVRAGHDPALVYCPEDDRFEELRGQGLPLGVLRQADFELNERTDLPAGRIIVIGTDGIWEATSPDGEMFGKQRLQDIVRAHRDLPAAGIIREIVGAVNAFRGNEKKADDMTVAVIRTG